MARRKTISDEQIHDILLDTILETGPAGLTFARAAADCGLAPATLVQRYGDRETMVQAILLRAWDVLDAQTEAADAEEESSPQGAIEVLIRLMPTDVAERNATDGLLLLRKDIRNPALRARGAAWGRALVKALGRRLSNDPERGERLGWQMASLWQGAHTWWAFTQDEPAERAIRRVLEQWLRDMKVA